MTTTLSFNLTADGKSFTGTITAPETDHPSLPMMVQSLMVSIANDVPEFHDATEIAFEAKLTRS